MLSISLIPLIPGLFVFSYIWVVDGGGDFFTCVPILLARWTAGWIHLESSLLRRVFIPAYLLMFVLPIIAYSLKPKRAWLRTWAALGVMHFLFVLGLYSRTIDP